MGSLGIVVTLGTMALIAKANPAGIVKSLFRINEATSLPLKDK